MNNLIKILCHEIYLDKTSSEEILETVIQKIKKSLIEYHSFYKKIQEKSSNTYSYKSQIANLNKILDQSLYVSDLLPRTATPILIILTDSNLCFSKLGKYNNILMQLNRVDINISIIDLYSTDGNLNPFSIGFINNDSIMKHVSYFTGGCYFKENDLSNILKIDKICNNGRNILNFNKSEENKLKNLNNNNYIKCKNCAKSIEIFFCKKPYMEKTSNSVIRILNERLEQVKKSINDIGFNFTAIENSKILNGNFVYLKETV
jgi:hypothetical protein